MGWIGLAEDRDRWLTLVSVVMNLQVPWNAGKILISCKPVSCARRTVHHGVSKYVFEPSYLGFDNAECNLNKQGAISTR